MDQRAHLETHLNSLIDKILQMGKLVEEALLTAMKTFESSDKDLAKKVVEKDKELDDLCIVIEEECIRVIATEQPVASDLRLIMSSFQISTQLERIGDHAKFIARSVKKISQEIINEMTKLVRKMLNKNISMMQDALKAFSQSDEFEAIEVAKRDEEIDKLYYRLYNTMLAVFKQGKDDDYLEEGVTVMFLIRFLERIGDHIANICEWIIYAKTGRRVDLN